MKREQLEDERAQLEDEHEQLEDEPTERYAIDEQERAYYALGGQDVDADYAAWLRFRARR